MRFALSTNWCNKDIFLGEEIADKAIELGFDALELGFNTTPEQITGFKRRLNQIPIESVHAYCPVPVSAPSGSPELYSLASLDENERAMARIYLLKTLDCASSLGAKTVVLHAGRVAINGFFSRKIDSQFLRECLSDVENDITKRSYRRVLAKALAHRAKRVSKVMPIFLKELESIIPICQQRNIVLALENLPFLEGFPNEGEMLQIVKEFADAPIKAWFDTGHHHVRLSHGWLDDSQQEALRILEDFGNIRGMHLNDVKDYYDDHFAPGGGSIDFSQYNNLMQKVEHIVFEPKGHVSAEKLSASLCDIRNNIIGCC